MEEKRKGNPIASARFRWQVYMKDEDYPMESEWEQFENVAIKVGARYLIRNFEKFKKDDIVVKVFNEMNWQRSPKIITLQDAYKIITNAKN